jgi:hypothetical protein
VEASKHACCRVHAMKNDRDYPINNLNRMNMNGWNPR